jgi:hypothetical protein
VSHSPAGDRSAPPNHPERTPRTDDSVTESQSLCVHVACMSRIKLVETHQWLCKTTAHVCGIGMDGCASHLHGRGVAHQLHRRLVAARREPHGGGCTVSQQEPTHVRHGHTTLRGETRVRGVRVADAGHHLGSPTADREETVSSSHDHRAGDRTNEGGRRDERAGPMRIGEGKMSGQGNTN